VLKGSFEQRLIGQVVVIWLVYHVHATR
jgi:hypothetical protein